MSASEAGPGGGFKVTRENVEAILESVKPEAVDAAVESLFGEDGGVAPEVLLALSDLVNAYARIMAGYAEALEGLEPEERSKLLGEAAGKLDGEALGSAVNAGSRLMMKVGKEKPELAAEVFPAIKAAIEEIDFGKFRVGTVAYIEYAADLASMSIDAMLENPVIVANLVGILPPLINNLIKVISGALSEMDLPQEVLASAVFNIILEIDTEELGRAVTSASKLVNELHEGNLILGRDEPRFRAVFAEFAEGILENVDTAEFARAVVSLGEDFEVVLDSVTDILHRDPELLILAGATVGSLLNVALRGLSNFMLEFSQLPDEILLELGEDIRQNLEVKEVARIINLYIMLANRFMQVNPALYDDLAAAIIPAIDTEQLGAMLKVTAARVTGVVRDTPELLKRLEPEEIGGRINETLISFNRYMAARPGAPREFLSRMLGAIDTRELETAVRTTVGGLTEAMFESADRALAFARPVAGGLLAAVWSLVLNLKRKILG